MAGVKFDSVYPGIDLVYYGNQQQLEYDFVVAPGADASQIHLTYSGADSMKIDSHGDLILTVQGSELRQQQPKVYQGLGGQAYGKCPPATKCRPNPAKCILRWRTTTTRRRSLSIPCWRTQPTWVG